MKKNIITMVIFICLFFCINTLNANEKESIKKNNIDSNEHFRISFSKAFRGDSYFGLIEKMDDSDSDDDDNSAKTEKYQRISKNMRGLGTAGAVLTGFSTFFLILGIVVFALSTSRFLDSYIPITQEEMDKLNEYGGLSLSNPLGQAYYYMYWAGAVIIGIFTPLLVISIAMTVVGFVLSHVFKKKAETISMFIEGRKGVISTLKIDSDIPKNIALGLSFSL